MTAAVSAGEDEAGGSALADARRVVIGHSVDGRAIVAVRIGERDARRKVLVVGNIHGDEQAGLKVIRVLKRRYRNLRGVDLWLVGAANPDGLAVGGRKNAHGVDLNRNFSVGWGPFESPGSGYYQGPRPFSEPEARAARDLLRRLKPRVTIWYHQPWGAVLAPCRGSAALERRYSEISGLRIERCHGERLPGTATRWQEAKIARSQAFVVEFPGGEISSRTAKRHARAAAVIARSGAAVPIDPPPARPSANRPSADRASASFGGTFGGDALDRIRPRIVPWRIPYGAKRKRQMAAYSLRHYGKREWRLRRVELIVEHYAVTNSAQAIYNTFAPNRPDVEFGELPGVCAHFVINGKGRIFQLVGLRTRCRHAAGVNHLSVGIEHTGYSDGQVISNERQIAASLRLSRWLRCRYRVPVKRVIGHNEVPNHPLYHELVAEFRNYPPHGDFRRATMKRYRRKLASLGRCPR